MAWLRTLTRKFADDRSGAIAIMFVLVLIIFVCIIGVGIDMGRAQRASAEVVGSIDSAALAGAKGLVEDDLTDRQVRELVVHYLEAELGHGELRGASYSGLTVVTDASDGSVAIDVDIHVPTTFTRIANSQTIDFHKFAKTAYRVKNVELAMVLDTTGSMGNFNKIDEMKVAAAQAIDILLPAGKPALNRIALAPFSASVNVTPYSNAVSGGLSANCVVERPGADAYNDVSGAASPVGTAAVGTCPAQTIIPLSKDAVMLKNQVNAYMQAGGTAGQIGLAWGWYLISPNWNGLWPTASKPKPYADPKAIKAILLMTDGMFNTAYFNDTSPAQAALLCDAIKAQGITIYAVGFELALNNPPEDVNSVTLLTACASDDGAGGKEFYNATNGSDLSAAFTTIAGKMMALRLTE